MHANVRRRCIARLSGSLVSLLLSFLLPMLLLLLLSLLLLQVRMGATLRFPRSLPLEPDDTDAFKLDVHRLSLRSTW